MKQSRRVFLQALGAGVAFVSLPEVSAIFNLLPSCSTTDDMAATLHKLFFGEAAQGGAFVAHAETIIKESSPQQLLNSPSALIGILEQLGVNKTFSNRADYNEASQCRQNFEEWEAESRNRFGGEGLYTDVQRPPSEKGLAIMVSGNVDPINKTLNHAEGAVQYQQGPAVHLAGRDPGIILAAPSMIQEHVELSNKELARTFALLEPSKTIEMDDGQRAHRYETPVSSVVYIPRPRRNNRVGRRAAGVLATSHKRDPNNIYFADLYI